MDPMTIFAPLVLVLAYIGYVACLVWLFWGTLLLTTCLAAFMFYAVPFSPENLFPWIAAGVIVVSAMVAAKLLPAKSVASTGRAALKNAPNVVIDGTNVMYWDGEADLHTLRLVLDQLKAKGMSPFVFLDASTRHHLGDKSLDDKRFAKALGLHRNQVMVCPARTEADAFILKYARENQLPVVSNDRFGDRAAQLKGIKLIKGGIASGKPILHGI